MQVMTNFKALSLIQARNYVRDTYGEEGVLRVKAALSAAARDAVYSEHLMATDWVDIEHCIEHVVTIDRVFGDGDGSTSATLVRTITNNHFNSLYRPVLAASSPREMLERTSRLWNRYYDRGETSVEFPSRGFAIKRVIDCPDLPLRHDWFLVPFYEELLMLCGATEALARHTRCVALGAECCVTEIRWKE